MSNAMMNAVIDSYLSKLRDEIAALCHEDLKKVADALLKAYHLEKTIFVMGNGGSASTASHFCNDLNKGTIGRDPDGKRFKAIGLTDNIPLLTAWSNDSAYEDCFVEQLRSLWAPGSVILGISGSGNSENVLRAMRYGRQRGSTTIAFTGFDGGKIKELADIAVVVPSNLMARVEDLHMIMCHVLTHVMREEIMQGRKTVFIDRDGVINRNVEGDYVRSWRDFHFLPGALDAIKTLTENNCDIHIISNQAGVAKGLMTQADVDEINGNMVRIVESHGGRVAGVHVCTHHPDDNCDCRKPKPGLLFKAVGGRHSIFPNGCFVIGDALTDVRAGRAVGAKTFLVLTGRGKDQLRLLNQDTSRPDWIVPTLREAVDRIVRYQPHASINSPGPRAPYESPDIHSRRLTDDMLRRRLFEVLPKDLFADSANSPERVKAEEERLRARLEEHPTYPDLHYNLALLLMHQERYAEAVESLRSALEINPRYVDALYQLGVCEAEMGRLSEARATFEEVRGLDWRHQGASEWIGRIDAGELLETGKES